MNLLYNEGMLIGRLASYFSQYFPQLRARTLRLLLWLLISMLALGSCPSIRFLYRHFLKDVAESTQNCYYRACRHEKVSVSFLMRMTIRLALGIIPGALKNEPVFLSTDDTTIPKFGKKFFGVSILHDHARHGGKEYVNGHCFVSLTLCVPVLHFIHEVPRIRYVSVPVGYAMWTKEGKSKLEMAADMIDSVMGELAGRQVILSCDSWYARKSFLQRVLRHPGLDVITNARVDSAMFGQKPKPTGRRGRPRKRGERVRVEDFECSYRMDGFLVGHRCVLTNIFDERMVHAYVTLSEKGTRRLFFSTLAPMDLHMSCAWQEEPALRKAGARDMKYYPLRLYGFRWNIETNYYEQKTFWSLRDYRLRSKDGIEHLQNFVNIAHAAMRILPYSMPGLEDLQGKSAQEVRFVLGKKILHEVFFAKMARMAQIDKNSEHNAQALKWLSSFIKDAA